MPLNMRAMLARRPQHTNKYQQPEERNCAVIAGIAQRFLGCKRTDEDNSDNNEGCDWSPEFLRDQRDDTSGGGLPNRLHGSHDDADGNP